MKPLHHRMKLTEPANAVDALSAATGLPKARIKDAMSKGAVWVQRGAKSVRLRRASRVLDTGEELSIYYNAHSRSDRLNLSWCPTELVIRSGTSLRACSLGFSIRRPPFHSAVCGVSLDRPSLPVHRLDRYTRA